VAIARSSTVRFSGSRCAACSGTSLYVRGRGELQAETVRDALADTFATLPAELKRSLTWDQGSEMALHHQFGTAAGLPVYFCDPHSPR
jgi:IS30 family transposase